MDKKSKKGLNLKELETRLDEALENETKESLSEWLESKREADDENEIRYSKADLKAAFKAGRKQTSRLTCGDEYIDEWKYTFKEWFNKLKNKK